MASQASLEAAISALADDDVLILENEDYTITTPVTMTGKNNVKIIGRKNTRFVWNGVGAYDHIFKMANCRWSDIINVKFFVSDGKLVTVGLHITQTNDASKERRYKDLCQLDFDAGTGNARYGYAVQITDSSDFLNTDIVRLDRCRLKKFVFTGLGISGSPNLTVNCGETHFTGSDARFGIFVENLESLRMDHCQFSFAGTACIYADNVRHMISNNCLYLINSSLVLQILTFPNASEFFFLQDTILGAKPPTGIIHRTYLGGVVHLLDYYMSDSNRVKTKDPVVLRSSGDISPIIVHWTDRTPKKYLPCTSANCEAVMDFCLPPSRYCATGGPTIALDVR